MQLTGISKTERVKLYVLFGAEREDSLWGQWCRRPLEGPAFASLSTDDEMGGGAESGGS